MTFEPPGYVPPVEGRAAWDSGLASDLLGAIVLVGITYVDAEEKPVEIVQYYGMVTEAVEDRGVAIECHGVTYKGQTVWLPPDLRAFQRAPPGTYRMRETGEVIVDPGFTTSWTIVRPEHQPQ
ncbi:MAG: hypothetical protein H7X89_06010 [Rhizobiales bacterium]|nr:hypothetical protein [Hyphomicrobiales bacterium]